MKLKLYKCEFCGTKFPLVPISFECPECGLRHVFQIDSRSCINELFLADIKCPKEKTVNTKRALGSFRKKKPQRRK